jgi:hypothetical protein
MPAPWPSARRGHYPASQADSASKGKRVSPVDSEDGFSTRPGSSPGIPPAPSWSSQQRSAAPAGANPERLRHECNRCWGCPCAAPRCVERRPCCRETPTHIPGMRSASGRRVCLGGGLRVRKWQPAPGDTALARYRSGRLGVRSGCCPAPYGDKTAPVPRLAGSRVADLSARDHHPHRKIRIAAAHPFLEPSRIINATGGIVNDGKQSGDFRVVSISENVTHKLIPDFLGAQR